MKEALQYLKAGWIIIGFLAVLVAIVFGIYLGLDFIVDRWGTIGGIVYAIIILSLAMILKGLGENSDNKNKIINNEQDKNSIPAEEKL
jgi:cytochrome c biogenesis protein CcdA